MSWLAGPASAKGPNALSPRAENHRSEKAPLAQWPNLAPALRGAMTKARIGVIGSGDVGKRLATGFAKLGHPVMMGTREPKREDVVAWAKESGAKAGTNAEAAAFGEVLVLATAWEGTRKALEIAGLQNLKGKLLLDVTNPLAFVEEGKPPVLAVSGSDSAGESVARWAPGAKVVKTLNMVNNAQ